MSSASSGAPEPQGERQRSRRSLLRGGTVLGLSMMAGAGLAKQARQRPAATGPAASTYTLTAQSGAPRNMILDYRFSQPTGWPKSIGETVGMTIGGHVASSGFTFRNTAYTVSLVPFGQSGDSPDPVYEAIPADSTIKFQQTLDSAFSDYCAFRYVGGSPGWGQLSVQSYSTFVIEPTQTSPALVYGADMYIAHIPGHRWPSPATRGNLQWIQVVNNTQAVFVDNSGRANPFYLAGGLTSTYGHQVTNFYDRPQASAFPGATGALPSLFTAEVFLAEDTGIADPSGRGIVTIFGGLKYGWQLQQP